MDVSLREYINVEKQLRKYKVIMISSVVKKKMYVLYKSCKLEFHFFRYDLVRQNSQQIIEINNYITMLIPYS